MANELDVMQNQAAIIPGKNEWTLMRDMAASLVPTGFLPDSIKTPEQAVAIMLKGRELNVPPMYALSNIAVVKGKPTVSAEMMLALIYRDHGKKSIRVKESTDTHCVVEYRLDGWADVSSYTFTIGQAQKAGLTKNPTWSAYPAAMLRARCISAVARMAFPESIAGMYVPGELGESVTVSEDGEVRSVSEPQEIGQAGNGPRRVVDVDTGEIHDARPVQATATISAPADPARQQQAQNLWRLCHGTFNWDEETLDLVAWNRTGKTPKAMDAQELKALYMELVGMGPEERQAMLDVLLVPEAPAQEAS